MKEDTRKKLWFIYICIAVCWWLNAFGFIGEMYSKNELFAFKRDGHPFVADFVMNYSSGQLLGKLQTEKFDIYDPQVQERNLEKLIVPIVPELPFYAQYPPPYFPVCWLFTLLPFSTSYFVWCGLGLIGIVAGVLLIAVDSVRGRFSKTVCVIDTLASFPVWQSVRIGQAALLVFAPMTFFWTLTKMRRYFLAGLSTMLLVIKIQYLPFLVVIGLSLGRLPFLFGGMIAAAVVAAICSLTMGFNTLMHYPSVLAFAETTNAYSGVAPATLQNIRGMLVPFFGDTKTVRDVSSVFSILSLLGIIWLWNKSYKALSARDDKAFDLCAAVSVMATLVFSLHTHMQDYMLMALPGIWLWGAVASETCTITRKQRKVIKFLILLMPAFTWIAFLLNQIPGFPLQPMALYNLLLLCLTLRFWFWKPPPNGRNNQVAA